MADRYLLPGFEGIRTGLTTGSADVSATGLVLAYDMETLIAGQMNDFSGLANHGTITGTTSVAGKFGLARDFDGVDDEISMSGTSLDLKNDFTVSIWFNGSVQSFEQLVWAWGESATGKRRSVWIQATSGNFAFSGFNANIASTTTVTDGIWHNLVVTVTSANLVTLYVDGLLVASGTPAIISFVYTTTLIGRSHLGEFTKALLDEPLIFNRVLSDAEIKALSRDRTRIATDTSNWSATSGGTGGASVPSTVDTVKLDINSGSGTGTMNAAMSVLGWNSTGYAGIINTNNQALTIGTGGYLQGGTLQATGSTITMNGNWDSSAGTFTQGTSTVVFAATGNLTTPVSSSTIRFYNLTINAGVTVTATTDFGMGQVLTVNGTLTGSVNLGFVTQVGTWLVVGGSGSVSGITTIVVYASSAIANIAATTYNNLNIRSPTGFNGRGNATLLGNIVVNGNLTVFLGNESMVASFTTGTYNVTVSGNLAINAGAWDLTGTAVLATTGTWSIAGNVSIASTAPAASSYITSTSLGSWTVSGTWTNSSTSGSWSFAAPITFNSGANQTMTFAGANLSGNEFNNVTLNSTSAVTYTMASRGLRIGGALSITNIANAVGLTTSNLAVTAGSITIGTNGTLTAGSSIITVNGNWDSSVGTFTFGTSTVVFAANGSINVPTSDAFTSRFYNLTVNIGITATMADSIGVANVTTVNGTLAGAFTIGVGNNTAVATPLVVGGSGSVNSTDMTVTYATSANSNVTSTTYYRLSISGYNNPVATALGNITVMTSVTVVTPFAMSTFDLSAATVFMSGAGSTVQWGSGFHTISGAYTNNATGASWDAGTGTVLFNNPIDGTMTFAGTNLAEDEFNNVTFTSSAGTPQIFTMATRGLRLGGTLTVSDGVSTTTLDTSVGNLAITAGAVTIGAGGILTANGSTITVNGNFNFSVGTFTQGTSTINMTGAGTTITISNNGQVNNLILSATGTVTITYGGSSIYIAHLTINAGAVCAQGNQDIIFSGSGTVLVNNGTINCGMVFRDGHNVTGTTYTELRIQPSSSGTATAIGNVVASSLRFGSASGLPLTSTLNLNGFSLTVSGTTTMSFNGGAGILVTGASTVSLGTVGTFLSNSYITSSPSGSWSVSGSWTNASTSPPWDFNAPITFNGAAIQTIGGTGTKNIFKGITFTGGDKSITSDITMESLDSSDVARTLTMTNGKILTYTGSTTADKIRGLPIGGLFKLRSSLPGIPWKLNALNAGVEAMYVDVQDSDASGGAKVSANEYSINSGNNTNWLFKRPPTVTTMSGSEDVTIKLD